MLGAIVGYTNAGKSSLLNLLSKANVFVENKLFATLDPTTKIINTRNKQQVILTDTVGFIRKLPHNLVEAFKSTLEEVSSADFLIHVLDVSNDSVEQHYKTTITLLEELKSDKKPVIVVFNKIDKIQVGSVNIARIRAIYPESIFMSTITKEGVSLLFEKIDEVINKGSSICQLKIPTNQYDVIAKLYRIGAVLGINYEDDFSIVSAKLNNSDKKEFKKFNI